MYNLNELTSIQRAFSTIKILPVKSEKEIQRVLTIYNITQEDFMLQLTSEEMNELALLEKSGDFGPMNNTQPGDEFAHLSDVELLAHLNAQGDFSSTGNPYNGPDFIAQSGNTTIIIQAKRRN